MIPKECKRLAEVDFPIAVVSRHAAREKATRHGHPSALHMWWARRPLASCRAMLLALLLPDPCDLHCPNDFKQKARTLLSRIFRDLHHKDEQLRRALLRFIGDSANWDVADNAVFLEVSRGLIRAAQGNDMPLIVDPFAGGGSIPLEALRLGCESFSSDLNPVACLIQKVVLEDIPRLGPVLIDELRALRERIRDTAEDDLAEYYPPDPDGTRPIAYVWARTVQCESPNCGAEIPLLRSFWLSKKASRKLALKPIVRRPRGIAPCVDFEIIRPASDREVQTCTVSRAKATCLACNTVLSPERVRAQLAAQRGGADAVFNSQGKRVGGARLLAVVTLDPREQGRHYRLPLDGDYLAVWKAVKHLESISKTSNATARSALPDEPIPLMSGTFNVPLYGVHRWGDLFSARQKLALLTVLKHVQASRMSSLEFPSLLFSKHTELTTANCPWEPVAECPRKTFSMQALPMRWEFAEGVITSTSSGGFQTTIENSVSNLTSIGSDWRIGSVNLADACEHPLPDDSADIWFTDPPYYFAVPYADLSDFFFVWLKRALPDHSLLRDPFDPSNVLTPKDRELCEMAHWDHRRYAHKGKEFFEDGMSRAFAEGRRVLKSDGIGCVVFAHKTTEGWEALLSGLIRGGWVLTASWPIQTEQVNRPRAREAAALSASIHLVCRPRPEPAPVGDWVGVIRELPKRVGDWMQRLESEGVRGADLVFACIGPALEIFSRHSKVETAEGREVELPEFLEKVWEVVGRTALAQVLGSTEAKAGTTGALEEDARLTALFLWTLQSSNENNRERSAEDDESEETEEDDDTPRRKTTGFSLIFDVARRFAQPLGIHLPDWEGRIIETEKGVVRLLTVTERAKQLFGEEGAEVVADQLERGSKIAPQLTLFPDREEKVTVKGRGRSKASRATVPDESMRTRREATTLDRIHAAMLLQSGGRANALRALLKAEQERSPDFLRLANALSALYPKDSEEKPSSMPCSWPCQGGEQ